MRRAPSIVLLDVLDYVGGRLLYFAVLPPTLTNIYFADIANSQRTSWRGKREISPHSLLQNDTILFLLPHLFILIRLITFYFRI